ncbi:MAG: glycosyltransferase [Saprospiraceae bacterium]|nr:glycosyltransferase [Saprospiraceae bacterium]
MKILLVSDSKIPITTYDDAERVLWWLGKALVKMGHKVVFLAKKDSKCPFAEVLPYDEKKTLDEQIPADTDLVHFHCEPLSPISKPWLATFHGNASEPRAFDRNTVFVSAKQAWLHGGTEYVHHGIDFEEYGSPEMGNHRMFFHFLGNAAWRGKNVRGAIDIASKVGARLHVVGGTRVNFRKGLRITLSPNVRFHGVLNPEGRNALLNSSKGLIFPAIWHEPFGLAVAESLYFGCPVFGTPYGALPELLGKKIHLDNGRKPHSGNGVVEAFYCDFGCLSVKKSELLEAVRHAETFDRAKCHEYAREHFSAARMAQDYLVLYERVLNGDPIHPEPPTSMEVPGDMFLPFGE